jgi:hypothetical protein
MNKRIGAIVAAIGLGAIGVGVGLTVSSSPTCQSLTASQVVGTFHGSGCYDVGTGLKLSKPFSIIGGTYESTSLTLPLHPLFQIVGTTFSISDATLTGPYTGLPPLVTAKTANGAGVKLIETTNGTISNTTIQETGGDCIEAFANPPKQSHPNTGFLASNDRLLNCGRDGISPSDISNSSFSGVSIGAVRQSAIDAESDIVGLGMGNVTFDNIDASKTKGVAIGETLTGPVNFNGGTYSNHLQWLAKLPQTYPISFSGGILNHSSGSKPAVIEVNGGGGVELNFDHWTFTRAAGNQAPLWYVVNHGALTFTSCILPPPLGSNDSTSTVTIN